MTDSKKRFSDRVADYVKYRPGYPPALLAHLRDELGLRPEHVVADIGSGTGIFSRLLLDNGNMVFGIEPNREMREAAEHSLEAYTGFKSMSATAEATTLPDATVDFVTCAQAFHWFEPMRARREFSRVLKRGGQALASLVFSLAQTSRSLTWPVSRDDCSRHPMPRGPAIPRTSP